MNSNLGLATLKSTAGCIGIRAQLKNAINTQLPRIVKHVAGEAEGEIWVSWASFFFSFLFYSSSYFIYFRRFRADYFLVFLLSLYFLDLDVIIEPKLNVEFNFFSNYYLECLKSRQISGIRLFQLFL